MYEFYKNYLAVNLADYENIGINLEISKVLFGLLVGIIIASIVVSWQRNAVLLFMRRLNRRGCVDDNTAKTLSELGADTKGVRTLLKTSSRIKRLVKRVGEKEYTYEEYVALTKKKKKSNGNNPESADETASSDTGDLNKKIDFASAKFYLKEPDSNATKNILDKKESSLLNTALMCLLLVCVYIILLFLMPDILTLINSILG